MFRTLLAGTLLAQFPCPAEDLRLFPFTETLSEQEMNEIAAIVRAICEPRIASLESAPPALALSGDRDLFAAAAWLIDGIQRPQKVAKQYEFPGVSERAVRIFPAPVDMKTRNELASLVRAITETRRLLTSTRGNAIILRGTEEQAAASAWLVETLTNPTRNSKEFRPAADRDEVFRVIFLPADLAEKGLNEAAAAIRAVSDMRRLMTFSASGAIAVGGAAEQVALAAWLARAIETEPKTVPVEPLRYHYLDPTGQDTEARVLHLPADATSQAVEEWAVKLRRQTFSRRIVSVPYAGAILFRGTPAQAALAEQLFKEMRK